MDALFDAIILGETLPLDKMEIDGTVGTEGMIILAMPVAVSNEAPTFGFLEQEPLGKAEAKTRGAGDAPKTPFGQLMAGAAFNKRTRGAPKFQPTTPAIRSMNWVVLPTIRHSSSNAIRDSNSPRLIGD